MEECLGSDFGKRRACDKKRLSPSGNAASMQSCRVRAIVNMPMFDMPMEQEREGYALLLRKYSLFGRPVGKGGLLPTRDSLSAALLKCEYQHWFYFP